MTTLDLPISDFDVEILCDDLVTETNFEESKHGEKVYFKNSLKIDLNPKTFGAFSHAIKSMTLTVKVSQLFDVTIDPNDEKPKLNIITNSIQFDYSYEHTTSGRNGCSANFYQSVNENLKNGLTKNSWTNGR